MNAAPERNLPRTNTNGRRGSEVMDREPGKEGDSDERHGRALPVVLFTPFEDNQICFIAYLAFIYL